MTQKTNKANIYITTLLLTLVTTFLFIISCDDSPNGPDEPEPGRRDYTWEVDTIQIPFSLLARMWGNTPDNIWAVGFGGSLDQAIWHYDGINWKTDSISRQIEQVSIFGFAENEVWIAGMECKIIRHNGNNWYNSFDLKNPGFFGLYSFMDIWGKDNNSIYAVGFADSIDIRIGLMFKYNGTNWERIKLPKNNITLQKIRKSKQYSNFFIQGRIEHNTQNDSSVLIDYNGSNFKLLYKDIATKATIANITKVGDDIFCSKGNSIYKVHPNRLELLKEFENSGNAIQIFGRSINDLFTRKSESIEHFDGNDTQPLFSIDKGWVLTDSEVLDQEIFILFRDYENGYNLVYHGY